MTCFFENWWFSKNIRRLCWIWIRIRKHENVNMNMLARWNLRQHNATARTQDFSTGLVETSWLNQVVFMCISVVSAAVMVFVLSKTTNISCRRRTRATGCLICIVLYTEVKSQARRLNVDRCKYCQLSTEDGRLSIALLARLCRAKLFTRCDERSEILWVQSIGQSSRWKYLYFWRYPNSL